MRKLRFITPRDPVNNDFSPVEVVMTEEDVKREYWPVWCENMLRAGKEHMISWEACWIDFKTVNWAEEIK